ncbi:F-box/LRR-repeat protein At3g03360-like [Silene latifolia]|uniref:F-box/LRR-repeat protein At3g03360-like n=1 Tax=Silene latifolia TaxID=37657 RepID=UPI003D782F45
MATKSRPSLESCSEENDDVFSELPEEILMSVMCLFTMKEAARFSLVSRQCEVIWRYFPVLIFEDNQVNFDNYEALVEKKACFVWRVDRIIEKHLGTNIDELRITCDLEPSWQSYVDKWVGFALDKQVKRLELNFSPIWRKLRVPDDRIYRFYAYPRDLPPKLFTTTTSTTGCFKSCFLTSLCLRFVNVNDEFVDFLPRTCPLLEMLCIQGSSRLTRVTGCLELKQLEVSHCKNLKKIDVTARKLQSLTLNIMHPVELLRIVDAPSLVEMSIGEAYTFLYLFNYYLEDIFSQLVYLNLRIELGGVPFGLGGMIMMNGVAMPKLEHLQLQVFNVMAYSSLRGCIFVIATTPSLQKLTLKLEEFIINEKGYNRKLNKWVGYGFPIKWLTTLEIVGYRGELVDLELAFFVLENATMLEEIILDFAPLDDNHKQQRLQMLQTKLPQDVKLIVK